MRSYSSKSDRKIYAAGKPKNEDDIKNKCYSIDDKTEKIEDKEIDTKIKDDNDDKSDKEDDKTIKPIKKENKKNKNTIKVKKEPLKPELKSKMKSKDKTKPAKPIEVNIRKITEFLLLDQDRGKTSTFSKTQNLVVKPAKQE